MNRFNFLFKSMYEFIGLAIVTTMIVATLLRLWPSGRWCVIGGSAILALYVPFLLWAALAKEDFLGRPFSTHDKTIKVLSVIGFIALCFAVICLSYWVA